MIGPPTPPQIHLSIYIGIVKRENIFAFKQISVLCYLFETFWKELSFSTIWHIYLGVPNQSSKFSSKSVNSPVINLQTVIICITSRKNLLLIRLTMFKSYIPEARTNITTCSRFLRNSRYLTCVVNQSCTNQSLWH